MNVTTDEDNSRNEIEHWTINEIGVAVQSWLFDTKIVANQMQIQNVLNLLSWLFLQQQLRS